MCSSRKSAKSKDNRPHSGTSSFSNCFSVRDKFPRGRPPKPKHGYCSNFHTPDQSNNPPHTANNRLSRTLERIMMHRSRSPPPSYSAATSSIPVELGTMPPELPGSDNAWELDGVNVCFPNREASCPDSHRAYPSVAQSTAWQESCRHAINRPGPTSTSCIQYATQYLAQGQRTTGAPITPRSVGAQHMSMAKDTPPGQHQKMSPISLAYFSSPESIYSNSFSQASPEALGSPVEICPFSPKDISTGGRGPWTNDIIYTPASQVEVSSGYLISPPSEDGQGQNSISSISPMSLSFPAEEGRRSHRMMQTQSIKPLSRTNWSPSTAPSVFKTGRTPHYSSAFSNQFINRAAHIEMRAFSHGHYDTPSNLLSFTNGAPTRFATDSGQHLDSMSDLHQPPIVAPGPTWKPHGDCHITLQEDMGHENKSRVSRVPSDISNRRSQPALPLSPRQNESISPPLPSLPPLDCAYCGKRFRGQSQKGNLKRHIRSFHPNFAPNVDIGIMDTRRMQFKCRHCVKEYGRTDARRKHEWKVHREENCRPKKRRRVE